MSEKILLNLENFICSLGLRDGDEIKVVLPHLQYYTLCEHIDKSYLGDPIINTNFGITLNILNYKVFVSNPDIENRIVRDKVDSYYKNFKGF